MRPINEKGNTYGRLRVIGYVSGEESGLPGGRSGWKCRCECGNETVSTGSNLRSGRTNSCGCYHKEVVSKAQKTHGMSKTQIYVLWEGMIRRCSNPGHERFASYGGRGISVCERWKDFKNFFEDMGQNPVGMTLDRIDNNLGYSPENCRWATHTQQARNKSNNAFLTYQGRTLCHAEWAEELGVSQGILSARVRRGWSDERVIKTPIRGGGGDKKVTFKGKTLSLSEWSRLTGINRATIRNRIRHRGWSVGKALTTPPDPKKQRIRR